VASIPIDNPNLVSLIEKFGEMIDLPIDVGEGLADKEEANRRISIIREACDQYAGKQAPQGPELLKIVVGIVGDMLAECEQEVHIESAGMDGEPMGGQQSAVSSQQQAPPMPVNPGQTPPAQDEDDSPTAPPSVVMMQNHVVFMDAIKDQMMTEAARSGNAVYNACLGLLWKLHFARNVTKDMETTRIEGKKQLMLEQMKADFAAKNMPPGPSPEDAAAGKIVESINFKDLPDDAKEQLLAKAGIQSSGQPTDMGPTLDDQKALEDHKTANKISEKVVDHLAQEHHAEADAERQEKAKNADLGRQALMAEHTAALSPESGSPGSGVKK
jgi:hypothetical protein